MADISRIPRELGYQPQVAFADGLRELLAWLRTQSAEDRVDAAGARARRARADPLMAARAASSSRRLERIVRGFARLRLLVVGDVMLDEYLWGDVERVSPEAPVPVVHVRRESRALGGAGNVVRNVVAMGARCRFCAVVGDDDAGDRIVDLLKELGVDPAGVVRDAGAPHHAEDARRGALAADAALRPRDRRADPGRGGAPARSRAIEARARRRRRRGPRGLRQGRARAAVVRQRDAPLPRARAFVAVDPKGAVAPYRGASLVKPNLREVEALSGRAACAAPPTSRAPSAKLRAQLGGRRRRRDARRRRA